MKLCNTVITKLCYTRGIFLQKIGSCRDGREKVMKKTQEDYSTMEKWQIHVHIRKMRRLCTAIAHNYY